MRSHGEGSIYRDGTGSVAAISVEGPDGRTLRRKRKARTQAEAREALRVLHDEARAGIAGTGRLTVAELLEDYLANVLPASNPAPQTVQSYTWAASRIVPAIGAVRLDKLRPEHVEHLLREMVDAGMSRSSTARVRMVLSRILAHAERRDLVARNVARLAVVPPGPVKTSRSMTLEQARAFLDANRGDRLWPLWTVMVTCGLRPGEALGLTWEAVDFSAGRLSVRQALRRGGNGRYELGAPKTHRRSVRTIDLPAPAIEALTVRLGAQEIERVVARSAWVETGIVVLYDHRHRHGSLEPPTRPRPGNRTGRGTRPLAPP